MNIREEIAKATQDFISQGNEIKKITKQEVKESEPSWTLWEERFYGGSYDPFKESGSSLLTK
jgi:hypothetical protein